ncbi:MAG: histidine phosphatase family protein [Kovacikia sp.]
MHHQTLKLLFIRHAESTGNREKRMQGHGDFGLTEMGQKQAESLARRLLAEAWIPSHVYTSPLKRAVQTAQILLEPFLADAPPAVVSDPTEGKLSATDDSENQPKAIPVLSADELTEFQNGIFQGLTWAEAGERYPELCQQLEASPDWIQIPEAESLDDARARARRFVQMLLSQHLEGGRIWIITHGWILQHLVAELLGCDRSWRFRSENTAIFEFWIDQSRWHRLDQHRLNTDLWQIRRFNDYRHLS